MDQTRNVFPFDDLPPPVWRGQGADGETKCRRVQGEPVLLVREAGEREASGRLLFSPERILRVRNSGGTVVYPQERMRGTRQGTGGRAGGGRFWMELPAPALGRDELFPPIAGARTIERHRDGRRLIHFSEGHYFHSLQVCVDYETEEKWSGPLPVGRQEDLPGMAERLAGGRGLRLAVLGDSISTGANASGRCGVAPFQPWYVELVAEGLRRGGTREGTRGDGRWKEVVVRNFSAGGKTAAWGADRAQMEAVTGFFPDLVVLAFGMNDASAGVSADGFGASVGGMIRHVRSMLPDTEFVLVSGMNAHDAWHLARADLHEAYGRVLAELALPGSGIVLCDVRPVWDYVAGRKGFWSMTGNGVNHPNDFGHRLYADCLLAVLGCERQGKGGGQPGLAQDSRSMMVEGTVMI
ncbi:lipolytic protein G-D-S-L family [Opitutaceae bacterium TAV5]|nr:lipolytic protein G-D-S-L family [Opitutaceae bacterium TAV5]